MLSCIRRSLAFPSTWSCKMSTSNSGYYDVIISGGGLIGGAMACALGSSTYFKDKKVLLLEGQSPPTSHISTDTPQSYSNRVCAISPRSKTLLEEIGVWAGIERSCSVKKMQVWDACSDALITFDRENMSKSLCYIIENNKITSSINKVISEDCAQNVVMKYNSRIKSCSLPRNYAVKDTSEPVANVKVELTNGQTYESALLIAADGANSFIAQEANVSKLSWNYQQSAVVATLKLLEATENTTAWQRFLPTGPIAMLPLDANHSSLVWSTSHEHAEDLVKMDDNEFVAEVNNAFWKEYPKNDLVRDAGEFVGYLLKEMKHDSGTESLQFPPEVASIQGKKARFPLGLSHSIEYARPRMALIGDSAHRIHPLAGQGANLGFGDINCLWNVLEQAIYEGKDLGCISHLMDYESERQLRNVAVTSFVDTLNRIYSTNASPFVFIRSLGLMGINASTLLKDEIIKQAIS